MWSVFNGTIINATAVALGSLAGVFVGARLARRYQQVVLDALGLVTIVMGVDAAVLGLANTVQKFAPLVEGGKSYGARLAMVMIGALLLGAIIGTALRLQGRVESLGRWIHRYLAGQNGHVFAEGFVTASVIFCVGPLTLVGCLEDGAHGNPSWLYIKALLDGFCALALASTLGWGVLASLLTVVIFQGGLSLLAYWAAEPLDELSLAMMTVVGGVVLLATGLTILEIKKLPLANLLPGIFLPPLIIGAAQRLTPGLLLPAAW